MALPDRYGDEQDEDRPEETSRRSRGVALGLCFFGGLFGLHRFYVGKPRTAVAMICTFAGFGVWWLYDLVLIAAGEFRDADELPLRSWGVDDPRPLRLASRAERRVEQLEDEVDGLRQQLGELAERMDFAERMLAQRREPPRQLPR